MRIIKILLALTLFTLNFQNVLFAVSSRSFDGTNDRVVTSDVHNVTTGNVSACAWVKPTEDAALNCTSGKRTATGAGYHLTQTTGDLFTFTTSDATTTVAATSAADLDGVWTFTCGTYDGVSLTKTSTIYENGVSAGSDLSLAIGSISNTTNFIMGVSAVADNDYTGLIAYNSVWTDIIMTETEMFEFMFKPDTAEIASGFWPLWGQSPELDLSASANTGTVTGASTSADGPPVMFGGGIPL